MKQPHSTSPSVILSGAKDLRTASREILRSAQDDNGALEDATGTNG